MSEGVTMTKRPRRTFTDEFKAETVRFVHGSGKSISAAARELDLSENAVRDWVRRADESTAGRPLSKADRDEVQQLRREVRVLRMERDILKKATAFFARESR
jgi:transposase